MIEQFKKTTFKHLPREENYLADTLATLATMFKINANVETQLVKLEVRESQAHCSCIQKEPDGNPWYHDILRYIRDQQYPKSANDNDKRTLRRLAIGFFLDGKVHKSVYGTHVNGHVMTKHIMRVGYYWLTLESDCINYV